jgi:tripartite-type tricarboxylate transporter receptor subunit TctC
MIRALIIVVALLIDVQGAEAQPYPDRPVRVIVPYPTGAIGDLMMRVVGQRLTELWGQAFVIENRAGGGGLAATEAVAKAPADGYTLLFNGPNHVTNLGLYDNVPYDPVADFAPIVRVASSQVVLVAHASTGFKSLQQLVDAAKAKPGRLNYGSSGNGTGTHLSMEMLMRANGINLTHVPYRGASPAMTAQVAGQVDVSFAAVPLAMGYIREGRLLPLVVGGSQRLPALPNVPSLKDLDLLNYDVEVWFGLLGPKETPPAVIQRLSNEIQKILGEPAVAERFATMGLTIVGAPPPQFGDFIRQEVQRWPRLVRELGIKGG